MKHCRRIVLPVLLVLALLVALVSCKEGTHTHTYADAWTSDANYHWHAATCEHTDEVKDKAAHTYENGACTVCGFKNERVAVQVVIDNAVTETIYTDAAHDYKITIPEKPEDITVNPTVEKYFYGWFTDPNYQTSLQADTTFSNNAKIYGKWIAVSPSDFTYSFGYGMAIITKYTGTQNVVVVPAYINNFPVTFIGTGAFSGQTSIQAVIIADGVIGIGDNAFYNCNSMKNITIPDGVTSIGESAFSGCTSLTSITVAEDNKAYHSAGNCLIETATKTLVLGCKNSVIPTDGSVTSIGDRAFRGCTGLTSITIPVSVTSIGDDAFSGCTSLMSITVADGNTVYHSAGNCLIENVTKTLVAGCKNSVIPTDESVTSIGDSAFWGCTSLTSITIPEGVASIGAEAFSGCEGLTSVTFAENSQLTGIGDQAFYRCTSLTSVTIPASVTSIGDETFSYCTGLASITIPSSVTIIGWAAFNRCTSLASITIPEDVTSIGRYAFSGCASLTSITVADGNTVYHSAGNCLIETATKTLVAGCKNSVIPTDGSVTSIGEYAFSGRTGLMSITIPEGVTSIGDSAFSGCTSLTSITVANGNTAYHSAGNCLIEIATKTLVVGCKNSVIPTDGSVTSIGSFAFCGCTSLTSITIPEGVTWIGDDAFGVCTSLTSITIPEGVMSIGWYAFRACTSLTSITIPSSVTSIGGQAFYGCTSLTSITYSGTKEQWNRIKKGYDWADDTGSFVVHCTDGDIAKNDA